MGWILFLIGIIGWHVGMYGMFKKAGIESWKAFIPFYNTWCPLRGLILERFLNMKNIVKLWINKS